MAGIELVGDLGGADPSDAQPSVEAASIAAGDALSAAPLRAAFATGLGLDSVLDRPRHARARRDRFRGRRAGPSRTWPPAAACPDRRPSRGPGTERRGVLGGGRTGRSRPELGRRSGPRDWDPSQPRSGPKRGPNSAQTCVDRLDAAGIRPLCSNGGARQTSVTEHGERAFAERGYPRRDPHRRPAVPHRPRTRRAGRLHPPPRRPGSRRPRRRPFRLRRAPPPAPRVRDRDRDVQGPAGVLPLDRDRDGQRRDRDQRGPRDQHAARRSSGSGRAARCRTASGSAT